MQVIMKVLLQHTTSFVTPAQHSVSMWLLGVILWHVSKICSTTIPESSVWTLLSVWLCHPHLLLHTVAVTPSPSPEPFCLPTEKLFLREGAEGMSLTEPGSAASYTC